jgi:hypothetical protein
MHFLEGVAWEELETTSKPLPTAKLIAMRNLSCIPIGSPVLRQNQSAAKNAPAELVLFHFLAQ